MKGFVLGVIVTLLCLAIGAYIYFGFGMAPVATSAQAMPFEKRLANMALHARVDKEAPKNTGIQSTEENYVAGAKLYVEHCAVCHSLPGQQQTAIAKGEFPKPPNLFRGKGVTDDPAGETYWKVANGIRLTGMPGFKASLSDQQIWQVAIVLANADKLPASATAVLTNSQPQAPPRGETPGSAKK